MMRAQVSWAEPKIVVESETKVHGLCELRAEIPSLTGLVNLEVQKKINDILSRDIREDLAYFSTDFETSVFCKEGLRNSTVVEVNSYILSDDIISISIHTSSDGGVHPWYELRPYNFDPDTGKKYSLSDLIPEDAMDWLKDRIKQQIEKDKHASVDDLDAIGKQLFEEHLETFFIERDELVFDFNTVLFGHANGPTGVRIKLREIARKLPKDNLLFRLTTENSGI